MPRITLATFDTDGLTVEPSSERQVLQALAIRETRADLVALLGVPSMMVVERFRAAMPDLVGCSYRCCLALPGNDPATGHPGVLSNLPIIRARSHRILTFAEIGHPAPADTLPTAPVFGRGCLELEVEMQRRRLTLFICHFTSPPVIDLSATGNGRWHAEAAAVRWIVERRFADPAGAEWVVMGSLGEIASNEALSGTSNGGDQPMTRSCLGPLLANHFAHEVATDAPIGPWTRFEPLPNCYSQPDHLLLSPALATRNRESRVRIIRAGLPYRAERDPSPRYPRTGWLSPAASLSCPLVVELDFQGRRVRSPRKRQGSPGGGLPGRAL